MAFTRSWDETFPPDTQAANLLGQDIRQFKTDIRERVGFLSGTAANRPSAGDMTTAWGSFGGGGVLYFATDTGAVSRWDGAAWVDVTAGVLQGKPTIGGIFIDPVVALNVILWRAPFACTVTNVRGYRVGGTGATINSRKNGTLNHLASALSLISANTWIDGGAVQNTAYAAGDKLEMMLVSIVGNPTQIAIQTDFTRL